MRTSKHDRMRTLGSWTFALALVCVLFLQATGLHRSEKDTPDQLHPEISRTVAKILPQFHYNHVRINDEFSSQSLDLFLERLDPSRYYFLASDMAEFEPFRYDLDDSLKAGKIGPAFVIFERWKTRAAERIQFAQQRLQNKFDFSMDQYFQVDRSKAPWSATAEELDEIWTLKLKNEALNLKLADQEWPEIAEKLTKRYANFQSRIDKYNSEDIFRYFLNTVSEIYDPHTAYFSPITAENFNIDMSLKFQGIGAQLTTEDEYTIVVRILPGGPAEKGRELAPNDKIIAVGQGEEEEMVDVVGWRLDDVVQKIRGPKGSTVRLLIIPAGSTDASTTRTLTIVRDDIILEERAAKSQIVEITDKGGSYKLGVINIPSFYADLNAQRQGEQDYRRTTTDVEKLLTELKSQKVDGVLIDLRGNGGGSLQEAIELTGLFIEEGPVVQVKKTRGSVEVENDRDKAVLYDGPLGVLVDRTSASASEIFAAAIQDYGRGVVIGSRTFGKGTVQSLYSLDRFPTLRNERVGQMKVTIAKFYRVTGSSTQHRGVLPDIIFPSIYDEMDYGESKQVHALPWDEIDPANFTPDDQVTSYLAALRLESNKRTANNSEFQYLEEDIQNYREKVNSATVSLNEDIRRKELEEEKAREISRVNARRASAGNEPLKVGDEIPKEDRAPDYMLEEAQSILANLINLSDPDKASNLTNTDTEGGSKKKSDGTAQIKEKKPIDN